MAKLTRKHFEELAASRNHQLINLSDENYPRNGKVTILCNTCNTRFTVSASSYQANKKETNRSKGCPNCKSIFARLATSQSPKSSLDDTLLEEKRVKKNAKLALRREKSKQFEHISNVQEFKQYLKTENNLYSNFILKKLGEGSPPSGCIVQKHHIIPQHAGGPDSQWNLVSLTLEDHIEAHALRYEVYGEFGDYNFLSTCGAIIGTRIQRNPVFDAQIEENKKKADKTRKDKSLGIYAPGVSSKGGQASAARERTLQQKYSHQHQMGDAVKNALYNGSRWLHIKTNTVINIGPKEALIIRDLKEIFIKALPENHPDRQLLENSDLPNIRKVIKTFAGMDLKPTDRRFTVAGFKLLEISEAENISD